jgi:hypothetical protein
VAPVVPIADEITGDLMVSLHRNLITGDPAPTALNKAIGTVEPTEAGLALRSSFVAFGA